MFKHQQWSQALVHLNFQKERAKENGMKPKGSEKYCLKQLTFFLFFLFLSFPPSLPSFVLFLLIKLSATEKNTSWEYYHPADAL